MIATAFLASNYNMRGLTAALQAKLTLGTILARHMHERIARQARKH